jgi:ribosomal protein S18 acetylase RimI-like enzyme
LLVKLYLLAKYRGMGLGSALLVQVLNYAQAQGKLVRLRVLRVNSDAKRLYERHGFKVVQETPERLFMESGA